MNIEQTTDFSSYLRSITDGQEPESVRPIYSNRAEPIRTDLLTSTFEVKHKGRQLNVVVSYPDIKSLDDYYAQGYHKLSGVIEWQFEQVYTNDGRGGIIDYTDIYRDDSEHDIYAIVDRLSEQYFSAINNLK